MDNSALSSGAAYVFTRNGTTWSQQAYLKASNSETNDNFGKTVAISGDTVVVGAHREDSSASGVNGIETDNSSSGSGAAYIFIRSGSSWSQQAYLKASNTGTDDRFGTSIAASGDTVVVGAWSEDSNAAGVNGNQTDNTASNSGAVYVFTRSGSDWSQQAYLKASNSEAGDNFGETVAISGDTVVVGAYKEDSNATGVNGNEGNNSFDAGAAYVFAISSTASHTVTFKANGGSGSMISQVASSPTALNANTFTRTGYSFSGWNTAANGSGTSYANGAIYNFTADITLYAQWTALPNTFFDVPLDYWAWQYIESLFDSGITGGCGNGNYCPTSPVTRAQMAVFLLKGIHGPSYAPPAVNGSTGFSDVATDYWAAAWIKQLAAEGITGGCGNGNYCPENTVTRDQMAVFLLKAKYGSSYAPPAVNGSTGFTDVPADYWAAAWIKQLAAEAITGGCGGGLYCPSNPVTRDQMAVFLQKTFNLPLP
ncbi:MAG: S-layer homology domain-containing protein [Anaerolineales bacterium]|nr:S-layer homology domain-containing protein [Anaerolineales bacterium]